VQLDRETAIIADWLIEHVGGTAIRVARQPRWRPQWFVDVERDGETLELLVRGDRRDTNTTWPLAHEMRFQRVLHEHGIPVPKVYGWIDELPAFVTDRVPGRPDFDGVSDAERDGVVDEYLHVLAAIHRLDLTPFLDAGIDRAARPDESGVIGMRRMEEMFRAQKVGPDPFLEFCLGWLRRNPPRSHGRESAIVWDSGQFHHAGGHLVAVLDLELAHIGDPMMDLAGWRMRDSIIPFGDFPTLYERYGELVGAPVDLDAIQLHHFAFTLSNQLAFSHALQDPPPGSDFATNLQWCNETNLYATEALAELLALELPRVEPIEARTSKAARAYGHLAASLRTMETDDEYLRHQLRSSFRLARHVMRFDEIGDAAVAADRDDLHALLGRRPPDWQTGDEQLERLVLADADDGRHDEQLLVLFHRRNLRAQMLNGPAGSAMARHNPIQTFRPAARRPASVSRSD
jgi:aminoglycoside phosphotransferase (APT) family kinase protein